MRSFLHSTVNEKRNKEQATLCRKRGRASGTTKEVTGQHVETGQAVHRKVGNSPQLQLWLPTWEGKLKP
jgi:hypothetical protein